MVFNKKIYFLAFFIFTLSLFFYLYFNKLQKEKKISLEPISINLLTSVHPNLNWNFKSVKSEISIKPGEVTKVEYIVENLGVTDSVGIATFAYYPKTISSYVRKINCFCYDAQTLKAKEKNKFTLVLLVDPEVTKDSKTKHIKKATIQFTFFDYKEHKEKKD
tara:strand:- start:179 stop:664 length:486 start_codon:yes stop_codon:yes gene_type:complete